MSPERRTHRAVLSVFTLRALQAEEIIVGMRLAHCRDDVRAVGSILTVASALCGFSMAVAGNAAWHGIPGSLLLTLNVVTAGVAACVLLYEWARYLPQLLTAIRGRRAALARRESLRRRMQIVVIHLAEDEAFARPA